MVKALETSSAWGADFYSLLPEAWRPLLKTESRQPYMDSLRHFLATEAEQGKQLYPPVELAFHALDQAPPDRVRVVILGQDPYHGEGQAHGLSFSVPEGVRVPPSLSNIYRELSRDLGLPRPSHGHLTHWAEQGVLLLNATLSVEQGRAGSHQKQGWERFTDYLIGHLNEHCEGLVFMLWGGYAQKKGALIDRQRHCVLEAVHPSPLSAHRGFIGCGHFSAANRYLAAQGRGEIDWSVPEAEFRLI